MRIEWLLLALLACGDAAATSVVPRPLEQLVADAEVVIVATVASVEMVDGRGKAVTDPQARTGPGLENRISLVLHVDEILQGHVADAGAPVRVPLWPMWHYSLGSIRESAEGSHGLFLLRADFSPVYPADFQQSLDEQPRIEALLATRTHPALACTADRLRGWARPEGIQARWPIVAALPPTLQGERGLLLANEGHVADGYRYRLLLDRLAERAYVVQTGGFAGRTTFFGPLPIAACPPASSTTTTTTISPRPR
ncbi:MAG TPA: hypothetical protein VGC74_03290 [Stenotrophomonas sp.]|jgi:hypothetical protein